MNTTRIAFACLGATIAYFAYGFAMFAAWPSMKSEFKKFPNLYREEKDMMKLMPFGMIAILISILTVAILYAQSHPAGGGILPGLAFGALIGIFMVCVFVVHNYVNLNLGLKLSIYQAIAYFLQWLIVGATIGLIYKPS